jgi:hypothetical protein
VIIEINTDSSQWAQVKHALREAGYKTFLQATLFDADRANLFLEPRSEPQGGTLKHGLLVFPGGCEAGSHSERDIEDIDGIEGFSLQDKPAAKSSTNVLNASVCQSCGCKLDGQPLKKVCSCRCHVDGVR